MLKPYRYFSPRTQTSLRALRSSGDNKPAFQYHHKGTALSFTELEEVRMLCSDFPAECRDECYAMFNIDGQAMAKYYRDALAYERQYQEAVEKARKSKSLYFHIGPFHIYISKD